MKVIGITGGVGAGKTRVLEYIRSSCNCRVIYADEIGNKVKEPGEVCYRDLVSLLGEQILDHNGRIDKARMAGLIFQNRELLLRVNEIIHPAVTNDILKEIEKEKRENKYDFLFIEAALLIECGYHKYVDEMWYIFSSREVRMERLMSSRGYSKEKTEEIMKGQLSEEEFRKNCDVVIENGRDFELTKKQIDEKLGEILWRMQKNTRDN